MKKYLFFFSLFLSLPGSILALNSDDELVFNNISEEIREYVNIDLEQDDIITVDLTYIIPEYFDNNELVIVSSLFKELNDISNPISSDDVLVRMSVINNSEFDYEYVDSSFILSTPNLNNYDVLGNYIGFDKQLLSAIYVPYRSYNKAIMNLFEDGDLSLNDDDINKALIKYGYKGIEDLDEYYLIFYNNMYGLNANSLEEFPYYVIKEIFSDDISDIKESNETLIKFAYYYWYNNLYSLVFEDMNYEYDNSYYSSIGYHLENNEFGNNYFSKQLGIILKNEVKDLTSFRLKINKKYYSRSFKDFNYDAYLEFKMNRVNYDDTIIPPNTGI